MNDLLLPGTRVFNLAFKHYGTVILDQVDQVECIWDNGWHSSIRKKCLEKVSDPNPILAALAGALSREKQINKTTLKENYELSTTKRFEEQLLELAIEQIIDLKGNEPTMFSESAVRVDLEKQVNEKNRLAAMKDFEDNADPEQADRLGMIIDQLATEINNPTLEERHGQ